MRGRGEPAWTACPEPESTKSDVDTRGAGSGPRPQFSSVEAARSLQGRGPRRDRGLGQDVPGEPSSAGTRGKVLV